MGDFLQREPNRGLGAGRSPGPLRVTPRRCRRRAHGVGGPVVAPMGRRDEVDKSEQLRVSLDPIWTTAPRQPSA